MKNKIIYFGDPLCSWCYGFGPEITQVVEHYNGKFEFELVMGGLRPYGTEKMPDLADMLRHHWEEVHQRSGVPFQYDILDNKSFVYDTEPPSRAVVAMKQLNPTEEFSFFKDIQRAFYFNNKDTGKMETYLEILEGRVSEEAFAKVFQSDSAKQETREMFGYSQQLGIRGFPSTIVLYNDKLYLVANGYIKAATLIQSIDRLVKEKVQ